MTTLAVRYEEVDPNDIEPNPYQPRETITEEEIEQLSITIKEYSLINPILLRENPTPPPKYQLIAGERRWRAAIKLGMTLIPAIVRPISEAVEQEELSLIENKYRKDLSVFEEGKALHSIFQKHGIDLDTRELAKALMTLYKSILKDPLFRSSVKNLSAEEVRKVIKVKKTLGVSWPEMATALNSISVDDTIQVIEKAKPAEERLSSSVISRIATLDKDIQYDVYRKITEDKLVSTSGQLTIKQKADKFITAIKKVPADAKEMLLDQDVIVPVDTLYSAVVDVEWGKEQLNHFVKAMEDAKEWQDEREKNPDVMKKRRITDNMNAHAIMASLLHQIYCPICGERWTKLQWTCHNLTLDRGKELSQENFKTNQEFKG